METKEEETAKSLKLGQKKYTIQSALLMMKSKTKFLLF